MLFRSAPTPRRSCTTVSAALGGHRVLQPTEAKLLLGVGAALVVAAAVTLFFPWILVVPFAIVAVWIGVTLLVNGWKLRRRRHAWRRRSTAQGRRR